MYSDYEYEEQAQEEDSVRDDMEYGFVDEGEGGAEGMMDDLANDLANEVHEQRLRAFRSRNVVGEDDAAIATILRVSKRAALQAHASNAVVTPVPTPPSLPVDVRFKVQKREWEKREEIIYSEPTFTPSSTMNSWSMGTMMTFLHTTIFNHDKPSEIITEKDSMNYVKSYFKGPYRDVYDYCRRCEARTGKVNLHEMVPLHEPVRLFMDLEMKKLKRKDLVAGENMTVVEEEKYVSWLKEHFNKAMEDAVYTYEQPYIDVSNEFLKNLARSYVNAATQDFTEDVCGAGTYVVLVHVKAVLRALLHGEVNEPNHPVDDIKLLSGCRPNKFSLHVMMDRIYCDRFLLSMPIIVSEIARFWSIDNAYWLLTHQNEWHTDLGKFRLRALMMEEMVTDQGFYTGINDTLWDERVYSFKRFVRCIGAVKPGCVYPLHAIEVPKDLRKMKGTFIRPHVKFCDTFRSTSENLKKWRSYTIYGGPHYSNNSSQDKLYLFSGWTPHELFPHIDHFRDKQYKLRSSARPYKESIYQEHFGIVREEDKVR